MSKKPSKNKTPKRDLTLPLVISLALLLSFVVGAMALYVEIVAVVLATVGVLVGLLFVVAMSILSVLQMHQDRKRKSRARRGFDERRKIAANLEAQYRKRDFDTRLRSYTGVGSRNRDEDVSPESQMEFWERDAVEGSMPRDDYTLTPSRPIELIRMLIQRISKLVGQGSPPRRN